MSENVSDNRNFESRQVPNDLEAERFLLGGILRDPEVMGTVIMVVTEEDFFYYERHKLIWRGLSGLYRKGTPIDLLTLSTELESYGKLAEAGGREYLFDLMESVASSANVEWNLEHLKNKSTLRKMIKSASETIKKAMDPSFNPDDVLQDAERDIFAIADKQVKGGLIEKGVQADALTHTYDVRIQVPNPDRKLLPGMVANVTFGEGGDNDAAVESIITLPVTCVQKNAGGDLFVWTIDNENAAHRTNVTIGNTTVNRVIIASGLNVGQRVITEGYQKLSEGNIVVY
jgi:hypothetical protein